MISDVNPIEPLPKLLWMIWFSDHNLFTKEKEKQKVKFKTKRKKEKRKIMTHIDCAKCENSFKCSHDVYACVLERL